jgi:hypothetical protein
MPCSFRISSFHMTTSPPSSVCVGLRLSVSWERTMMHVIRLVVRVRSVVLAVGHLPIAEALFFSSSSASFSFYHFLSMRIHTQRPSQVMSRIYLHLDSSFFVCSWILILLIFFPIDHALLCDAILYVMHENSVSAYVSLFHHLVMNMSLISLCLFLAFHSIIFLGFLVNRPWLPIYRRKSTKPEQPG